MELRLMVNGAERRLDVPEDERLLDALRDGLGLTGTKYGCGEGQCGACTVLADGAPIRSCQVAAQDVGRRAIRTIESLSTGDRLHAVQQAFLDEEALQCGYCTPGMIMAAVGLLDKTPTPTDADIRRAIQSHVCRCGTYARIISAVQLAARRLSPTSSPRGVTR